MVINESKLHLKTGKSPLATVEVDADSLEEQGKMFSDVIYESLMEYTAKQGKDVCFSVYTYFSQSLSFHEPTNSYFTGVVGKKDFLKSLLRNFSSISGVRAKFSDYINPEQSVLEYHVENGQVWRPYERGSWWCEDEKNPVSETPENDEKNIENIASSSKPTKQYRAARIVVVRSGWMKFYQGPRTGDKRPQRGGSFNIDNVGHESYNFKAINNKLYGFFQSPSSSYGFNLGRIEPQYSNKDYIDNVIVAIIASHPQYGGQWLIGWYKNATVFSEHQIADLHGEKQRSYQFTADLKNAVLLPVNARLSSFEIPRGKGGMGQTMVRYRFDMSHREEKIPWINDLLNYIHNYNGSNVLRSNEDLTKENTIETQVKDDLDSLIQEERILEGGQTKRLSNHFERNPKLRVQAIKNHGFECMACGFSFLKNYGDWGEDFIEVHHVTPVSSMENLTSINPKTDMLVLCSNCHRMIHRRRNNPLSLDQLKGIIKQAGVA